MSEELELHHCVISSVTLEDGVVCIQFSRVPIRSGEEQWTQMARICLEDGQVLRSPTEFPLSIFDGSLESDFDRFDHLLPLPFMKNGRFTVRLLFTNGEQLRIVGHNPTIELIQEESGHQQASHS